MDWTLKQLLADYYRVSGELDKALEQLRLLQAEYTDLKNRTEESRGANKSI